MSYLTINLDKIRDNFIYIKKLCDKYNLELVSVTKVCLSDMNIIRPLLENGAEIIGDCEAVNFKNIKHNVKKFLLRTTLSDINFCNYYDFILTSELKILSELSDSGKAKKINVFLALELGDYRDGILPGKICNFLEKALKIKDINITGIAGNLGCLMGKIADNEILNIIEDVKNKVKNKLGFEFKTISLGGTVIYDIIKNNSIQNIVNQVRLGEAIFFGYNMSMQKKIDELYQETFIFSGEIIELKEKNILPCDREKVGYNAFGLKTCIDLTGLRKRAVLDFGKITAPLYGLIPVDNNVKPAGATHNYTVVDITDCEKKYSTGDFIDFYCNYNSAAFAMMSRFVKKKIIYNGDK